MRASGRVVGVGVGMWGRDRLEVWTEGAGYSCPACTREEYQEATRLKIPAAFFFVAVPKIVLNRLTTVPEKCDTSRPQSSHPVGRRG